MHPVFFLIELKIKMKILAIIMLQLINLLYSENITIHDSREGFCILFKNSEIFKNPKIILFTPEM